MAFALFLEESMATPEHGLNTQISNERGKWVGKMNTIVRSVAPEHREWRQEHLEFKPAWAIQ